MPTNIPYKKETNKIKNLEKIIKKKVDDFIEEFKKHPDVLIINKKIFEDYEKQKSLVRKKSILLNDDFKTNTPYFSLGYITLEVIKVKDKNKIEVKISFKES